MILKMEVILLTQFTSGFSIMHFFFVIIVVITCDKVDIEHMSFSPPTSDTHDYNTTIIYSCDVGYNHSYGDLTHRCTETRQWTGTFPNCTSKYVYL